MLHFLITRTRMKFSPCLLIACALLFCLGLTAVGVKAQQLPQSPDAPGVITGVVTNGAGESLAGIAVDLYRNPEGKLRTVMTDASGGYRFGLLAAGLYYLAFRDPAEQYALQFYGGAPVQAAAKEIAVAGAAVTVPPVTLVAGSRITGTITHPANLPLGPVTLQLFVKVQNAWRLVTEGQMPADAQQYSLGGLPGGAFRFCVSNHLLAECYNDIVSDTQPIPSGLDGAQDLLLAVGQQRDRINFILGDSASHGTISGYVYAESGAPLANITVSAYYKGADGQIVGEARTTQTNVAGYYHLPYLRPGSYFVGFHDRGSYRYAEQYYGESASLQTAQPIMITAGSRAWPIMATLGIGGQVVGQVRIAGEVGNAVQLRFFQQSGGGWREPGLAVVDASGAYTATGLATGLYHVFGEGLLDGVRYFGYHGGQTLASATHIQVTAGTTLPQDLNFAVASDFRTGLISGTVRSTGQPVAGIQVEAISATNGHVVVYTTTQEQGRYQIAGLLDDAYYLRFSDPNGVYAPSWYRHWWSTPDAPPIRREQATIVLIDGARSARDIDGTLVRAGVIQGQVRLANGEPAVGVQVNLFDAANPSGWQWSACYAMTRCIPAIVTDQQGRYQITGLPPGRYYVGFFGMGATRYYPMSAALENADEVIVQADAVTTGINGIVGPLPQIFLPFVAQ